MTLKTRWIVLISTIAFFIIAAPLVIAYAWGYAFDWENKKPVMTGGLYFKSAPPKSQIYLNFKPIKETPALIDRLIPKDYQVKVAKDGYQTWQKKLRVNSGLVTEAKDILLIPTSPALETVNENIGQSFSLNSFINQGKEETEIYSIEASSYILYKTIPGQSASEQISLTPLSPQKYQTFISPAKKVAALGDNGDFYLLNNETKNFELVSQNVAGTQFSSDGKKLLYFTPSELWVYYLDASQDNKQLITRLSQRIKKAVWYGKTNEHIIFLSTETLKITELDGRDGRNTFDIFALENIKDVSYNPQDAKLYFVAGDKLLKVSLE